MLLLLWVKQEQKFKWTDGGAFQSTAVKLSKASRVQQYFIFLRCKNLLDTEVPAWVNTSIDHLNIDKKAVPITGGHASVMVS